MTREADQGEAQIDHSGQLRAEVGVGLAQVPDRVRVSLTEARGILAGGGRAVPALSGADQVRFRVPNDPQEQDEIVEGEVLVDGGKWRVCVQEQELRTALQRFGVVAPW